MMPERICVRAVVSGRVQGVWFRGWTKQTARSLGLTGWVRNRLNGTVEAVFAGERADVDAMLDHVWQGPPAARVTAVDVVSADDPGLADFRHLPTE